MRFFAFGLLCLSFNCFLFCDENKQDDFPLGGDLTLALDTYRSLPDGSWGGNMGAFGSFNLACALPKQVEGVGVQFGGSYGIYDWDGRGSTNSKALQGEGFLSLGAFRVTPTSSGVNAGLVYDWQFNREAGVFGLSPSLTQLRGQLGYLYKGKEEVGVWASYGNHTSDVHYGALPVKFKAISQVNLFWRHLFKNKGEMMIWAGTPYQKGLMFGSGRPGSYIVGASFRAPLNRYLSIEGHGMYMGARSDSADIESQNYAANVCFGLTYSFGGRKAGARPYQSLANNSNFIVDTNVSY